MPRKRKVDISDSELTTDERTGIRYHPLRPPQDLTDTAAWQSRLCQLIAETGNVTEACERAGVSRVLAYQYRARDPEFAARWEAAEAAADDMVEGTVLRLAREGNLQAALAWLKRRRPEWRDKREVNLGEIAIIAAQAMGWDADRLQGVISDVLSEAQRGTWRPPRALPPIEHRED